MVNTDLNATAILQVLSRLQHCSTDDVNVANTARQITFKFIAHWFLAHEKYGITRTIMLTFVVLAVLTAMVLADMSSAEGGCAPVESKAWTAQCSQRATTTGLMTYWISPGAIVVRGVVR